MALAKISQYVFLAFSNLGHRKTRSILTLLGIFIGIAAVVSLVSLGQGLTQAINSEFASVGADKLIIQAKSSTFAPPGLATSGKIEKKDLELIEKVNGVDEAAGRLIKTAQIEFNDVVITRFVASLPNDDSRNIILEVNNYEVDRGRMLNKNDRNKIVVGGDYGQKNVFEKNVKIGDKIKVNNTQFEVVGILKKTGTPENDISLIMNEDTMRDVFNIPEEYSAIIARAEKSQEPEKAGENIEREMLKDRNQEEGKEDFQVQTANQLFEAVTNVLNIVQAVFIGIAAISLLVGGIGIMNTMYTSVLERTKEIGIMKAVGARNSDVMLIFLIESSVLGLIGGAMGIAIGVGLSKIVEIVAMQALGTALLQAYFPPYLIIGSLLFATILGGLSGALPAYRASRLKPVDALKYE